MTKEVIKDITIYEFDPPLVELTETMKYAFLAKNLINLNPFIIKELGNVKKLGRKPDVKPTIANVKPTYTKMESQRKTTGRAARARNEPQPSKDNTKKRKVVYLLDDEDDQYSDNYKLSDNEFETKNVQNAVADDLMKKMSQFQDTKMEELNKKQMEDNKKQMENLNLFWKKQFEQFKNEMLNTKNQKATPEKQKATPDKLETELEEILKDNTDNDTKPSNNEKNELLTASNEKMDDETLNENDNLNDENQEADNNLKTKENNTTPKEKKTTSKSKFLL